MSVRQVNPVPVKKEVLIIGAGAAGLFCAAECGKRGRSVLVLDHADRIGSKLLISGGGRCNFTNLNVTPDHYFSGNPHFCRSALSRFSPQDIMSLLKKHRVPYYEKEAGQLFCATSSRQIVEMLGNECRAAGVGILLKSRVAAVKKGDFFHVTTDHGIFMSDALVVATGGMSYSRLGATGFGYALARQFGIPVTKIGPALVPLVFSGSDRNSMRKLSGISIDAAVSCSGFKFRGNVLFTHRGLSGPAILQVSTYWKKELPVVVDLLPDTDIESVLLSVSRTGRELKNVLAEYLPKRFAETWCDLEMQSRPMNRFSEKELRAISDRLHAWAVKPGGTEGFETAEVTVGGVDTRGISSKTMESKKVPGLYFIGEVLDVTGRLGGYNLHWAWASGSAAGQFA